MKNLPFVIWMVGAPIGEAFGQYVDEYLCKHVYSGTVSGVGALIAVVFYCFIGYKLYEKKS